MCGWQVGELILEELRFLVLPGHSLSALAVHVTIAVLPTSCLDAPWGRGVRPLDSLFADPSQVLAVYVVIDAPNTSSVNRYLWGASQ